MKIECIGGPQDGLIVDVPEPPMPLLHIRHIPEGVGVNLIHDKTTLDDVAPAVHYLLQACLGGEGHPAHVIYIYQPHVEET